MSNNSKLEIQTLFRGQIPLVYDKFFATHGIQTFPPHWHKHYELIRLVRGSLQLTLVNDEFLLKPGDIAFIDSNEAHIGISTSEDLIYDILQIKTETLQPYAASFKPLDLLLKKRMRLEKLFRDDAIYTLFDRVASIYENPNSFSEFLFLGLLIELFGLLISNHSSSAETITYQDNFLEIIDYINEHCAEKLTVEGLAKNFSFHVSYFSHKFKEHIGISPNKYILISRLKLAEDYLEKTDLSIDIIAQKCGFESTSYFIKKFKDHTGTTPVKYRKINKLSPPANFKDETN